MGTEFSVGIYMADRAPNYRVEARLRSRCPHWGYWGYWICEKGQSNNCREDELLSFVQQVKPRRIYMYIVTNFAVGGSSEHGIIMSFKFA